MVTKQTTFYDRILHQSNEIEIITLFDSRQNPDRLDKDIIIRSHQKFPGGKTGQRTCFV